MNDPYVDEEQKLFIRDALSKHQGDALEARQVMRTALKFFGAKHVPEKDISNFESLVDVICKFYRH